MRRDETQHPHTNLPECGLEGADLVVLDDHVASCEACRNSLCALAGASDALLSLTATLIAAPLRGEHPEQSVLQAYIQHELTRVDYELIESHIDCCPVCRHETDRLRWDRTRG